jgi:diacylglycerol kinase (ATP)
MKKMLFIMNPKAGRTTLKNSLVDVLEVFCNNDYDVRTYLTKSADDAERVVAEEGVGYDVIVCAGGDGTLGNTVAGFMKSGLKVPLGYIPCGSTNDFARSMEIPMTAVEAAEMVVGAEPFSVDIGSLNDKYFVYVAAFGVFSDTSYATPQNMKNIFGHAAYVLQGIKSIANIPSYKMKITIDGETQEGEFIFGMVSNSISVGGFKSITRKGVEFDDGLFEGVLIRTIKTPADLERVVRALLTGDISEKSMVSFRASNVLFEAEDPVAWTCDGEFGGEYKNTSIDIHRRAIDLLVVQESEA